jgi:hypothetical protein
MSRQTRIASLASVAALATAVGASGAVAAQPSAKHVSPPPRAVSPSPLKATSPLAALSAHPSARRHVRVPKRPAHRALGARSAAFSDAWFGSGAACVGTAVTMSIGRQFGLPAGTYFTWRSRLWMYNPTTGAQGWTNWSGTVSDRVTPGTYLLPDGTFVMGPSGGINPAPSPSITWTINRGWYVQPYAEVIGVGSRPVNFGYVAPPNGFAQPNWCYIA